MQRIIKIDSKSLLVLISLNMAIISHSVSAAVQLFMAGDSTMAIKHKKDYPETGWGMPFEHFFAESLTVINLAKNGRSTKTFIEEGLWGKVEANLKAGDYVIIQFGHNDESEHKKDRYTTPVQYKENLTNMINFVTKAQATPILMTPVTRRYFDPQGSIQPTHPYAPLVRDVAQHTGVEFIDMEEITRQYFNEMGDSPSTLRFMHIKPGLHPNYPNGVKDNTHFNHLGAREVAQLVLKELKKRDHALLNHLRTPDPKHLKLKY